MRRDPPAEAGFTLLETLVAMTVLALLSAVLLRGVVAVRADAAWLEDRTALTLLATSLLDEALENRRLPDGLYRGERDGRHWTLTTRAVGTGRPAVASSETSGPNWHPQRLTVTVEALRRPVVLETVRLAAPP